MPPPPPLTDRPLVIALTGALALAVAMGIGRFAFTPLLPMMLHDGAVDLAGGSALATANYLGYWLGALGCTALPALWMRRTGATPPATRLVRAGLAATVLLTLGMALPLPAAWPWLRALAGVASAVVLVYTSGWTLARLTALGAPALAGIVYIGPGVGIAVSGLAATAMVAQGWRAASGWVAVAALAALLSAVAWPRLRGAVAAAPAAAAPAGGGEGIAALVLAYGLAGFGYIVTATFLPVIARQVLPGSLWLDLFWPLFGAGVAAGALATLRVDPRRDRRTLLAACYAVQAAGVVLTVAWPALPGFALGSLLLGLPFTAITLFALQEARRLRPQRAAATIGLLTAAYGLGQIAGPPWTAWLLAQAATPAQGFALALETAAGALLSGVAIFVGLRRSRPAGR